MQCLQFYTKKIISSTGYDWWSISDDESSSNSDEADDPGGW